MIVCGRIGMSDHNGVVRRIARAFREKRYHTQVKGNNLPRKLPRGRKREESIYRPDLLVMKEKDGPIHYIVEVETSQPGKAVVGAAVLADACVDSDPNQQEAKPTLLFIFYRPTAKLQLAAKRLTRLEPLRRFEHLNDILFLREDEALDKIQKL